MPLTSSCRTFRGFVPPPPTELPASYHRFLERIGTEDMGKSEDIYSLLLNGRLLCMGDL